jgi:hypothetical protein
VTASQKEETCVKASLQVRYVPPYISELICAQDRERGAGLGDRVLKNPDCGPYIRNWFFEQFCGSGLSILGQRIRFRIQGFNDQKLNKIYSWIKIIIF